MKASALVIVMALACGSTFAVQNTTVSDRETGAGGDRAAAVSTNQQAKPSTGIVEKTKSSLRRVGDKIRATGDRISNKISKTNVRQVQPRGDTRTLAASPSASNSDKGNQDRQTRMDDAYGNWKSSQK